MTKFIPPSIENFIDDSFDKAIEEWREIGLVDIKHAMCVLREVDFNLKSFCSKLRKKAEGSSSKKLKDFVENQCSSIEEKIENNLKLLHKSFEEREKALGYCHIAFIGRSKAGKSTLWSIMTGTGFEGVGVGCQNTTRENREYKCKNIYLIDTPGVQTPDGEGLEEIAKEVIDKTDLICFVMTNNNQQKSEFRFLQSLREREKSFLILLNVKEDLNNDTRKGRFLKNPNKLFSVEDKNALGGHIERIRRYAEEFYGSSNFPIIPVQLFAAQLAVRKPPSPDSRSLWLASRFSNFLDGIKKELLNDGATLRCTQKNIGGLVSQITDLRNDLKTEVKKYQDFFKTTERLLEEAVEKAEKAREYTLQFLETKLKDIQLGHKVNGFAERHYDCSGNTITEAWRDVVKLSGEDMQRVFKEARESFSQRLKEIVEDLKTEFVLESRYASFSNSSKFEDFDLTSWRWFENITKSLLIAVALGSLGLVGGLVGGVFSLFSFSKSIR
ncbi:MAG: 50S ribosome-binding GTPase [Acetobacter sp.]|nr:50S ribosome-binding GTPase [Acetobacter sp.]